MGRPSGSEIAAGAHNAGREPIFSHIKPGPRYDPDMSRYSRRVMI